MKIIDEVIKYLEDVSEKEKVLKINRETLAELYKNKKQYSPEKKNRAGVEGTELAQKNKEVDVSGSDKETPRHVKADMLNVSNMDMENLNAFIRTCTQCELCKSRTHSVFGEGNYQADLMLIGEAPGRDEDQQGRPFVGKSGQLLTKMLKAMSFERKDVFIANIVKCRPPNNRNPSNEEAKHCIEYLNRQIDLIKPKMILLLGAVPLKYLLGKGGITKIHGEWFYYKNIPTMPSFHPAFLLRDPKRKRDAWEDLQKVMKFLGIDYNPMKNKEE